MYQNDNFRGQMGNVKNVICHFRPLRTINYLQQAHALGEGEYFAEWWRCILGSHG